MKKRIFFSTLVVLFSLHSFSQQNNLPEILTSASGKKIESVKQWEKVRRPEIQSQVEFEMYGMYQVVIAQTMSCWTNKQVTSLSIKI